MESSTRWSWYNEKVGSCLETRSKQLLNVLCMVREGNLYLYVKN